MRRFSEEGTRRRTEYCVSEAVPLGSFAVLIGSRSLIDTVLFYSLSNDMI